MEIFGALATIIGLVVGIVQLYKWLKKPKESVRYDQQSKVRPFIDIDVSYVRPSSKPRGISPNAAPNPGQNYYIASETLKLWELEINIVVTLVNNSDTAALYPKLYVHEDSFKPTFGGLNASQPIRPYDSIAIEGSCTKLEERIPRERTSPHDFPSQKAKNNFKLLVEYQNKDQEVFYTLFTGDYGNKYLEVRPDGFEYTRGHQHC